MYDFYLGFVEVAEDETAASFLGFVFWWGGLV